MKKGTRKGFIASDGAGTERIAPDGAATDAVVLSPPTGASGNLGAVVALLDHEELAYFKVNQIEGKTRAKCAATLGWPMAKVERIRRRLNLHLVKLRHDSEPLPAIATKSATCEDGADLDRHEGRFRAISPTRIYSFSRGNSLNPFYREKLSNGFSTWALCPSNQSHFPNLPIVEAAAIKTGASMPNIPLSEQLKIEQTRLLRVGERLHALRVQDDELKQALIAARKELDEEMQDCILEDRPAAPGAIEKKIAKFQSSLDVKRSEVGGAMSALEKQRATVEAIEGEIKTNARQRMLEVVVPKFVQFDALIDEMVALAFDASQDMVGHFVGPAELLPSARDLQESGLRLALFHDALRLRAHMVQSYSDHGFAAKRTA